MFKLVGKKILKILRTKIYLNLCNNCMFILFQRGGAGSGAGRGGFGRGRGFGAPSGPPPGQ